MLRLLVLSTLFPDATRPNFGIFVERQALSLSERDDVEVRVIAPVGIPPGPIRAFPRYRNLARLPSRECWKGLQVYRPHFTNIPITGGRFHATALIEALTPLCDQIYREFPFDAMVGEFFFPDGVAVVELGRRFGVPVSIKARGSDVHRWGHRPVTGLQVRAAGRSADGLLAVSNAMRDDMIALGMPGDRIETVVTGVDLTRFAPRDRDTAKSALGVAGPLVLSVGALIPLKGHDILIRAAATMPGLTLWIAGEGPDRNRLTSLIAKLGLGARVRLLGNLPHADLPAYLAAANAMALASEREGLANAWLEALASGTPIVIPDVGGARQVVTEPVAGRIVERKPEAFAAAIAAIVADPPSPATVRAIAEPFTWAANSARLHAHFTRLVTDYGLRVHSAA
ncbi:MAG: glycosyltransferase family 4 protein [Sphingomonadales bacterium]|nr:MAG: glycosyltransferase family 4 protein [Sphingomonadales bacterium]